MGSLKLFVFSISLLFLSNSAFCQAKHALLIGIAKYPNNKTKQQAWKNLNSDNDLRILKDACLSQGFDSKAITILQDEKATVRNIEGALNDLINAVNPGDVVMIHFSGHGQQVRDVSGDEYDGFDEAFVCHQAPVMCYEGYYGQDHLLDDSLGPLFESLRFKLGSAGHLLVLFDTCHSGTVTRGENENYARGAIGPLEFDCNSQNSYDVSVKEEVLGWNEFVQTKSDSKLSASMVVISACRADEINYEYLPAGGVDFFGSLSYAFVQVLNRTGMSSFSYALVLDELRRVIAQSGNTQTPQIEGDVYSKILNGSALEPSQYLNLLNISNKNVEIEGGFLAGHGIGDSIAFYSLSRLSSLVAVGVIKELHETRSLVVLPSALKDNYANYKAKHQYSAANNVKRTIKIIGENRNISEVKGIVAKYSFFQEVVEGNSDFTLALDKKSFIIMSADGKTPLRSMNPVPVDSLNILGQRLEEITRVEKFREFTQVDTSIAIDVRCVRMKQCAPCNDYESFNTDCLRDKRGSFFTATDWPNGELYSLNDNDVICVYAINNGSRKVYVSTFEVTPNGRIYSHPSTGVSYREIPVSDNPTPIATLKIGANDGYGLETIKIIISNEPTDLANGPIIANGTDLSKEVYFIKTKSTNNSFSEMFGLLENEKRSGLDGNKEFSIINIPLIMK
jgi:hypothetical protein